MTQDDFKKRRSQKNWIVLSLVLGCVALIWGITLLKLQALPENALHLQQEELK